MVLMDPDRNYSADMLTLIDSFIPKNGEFTSSAIAEKIVAQLEETDPDLLGGWLISNARPLLTDYVSDIMGRRRRSMAHQRRQVATTQFTEATQRFVQGDTAAMDSWLNQVYVVDEGYTRKRLSEMTKTDLQFVEKAYESTIKESSLEKEFIAALAKRVPSGKTVGEVWTTDKIETLRRSIAA